jgi:hypothetical protein
METFSTSVTTAKMQTIYISTRYKTHTSRLQQLRLCNFNTSEIIKTSSSRLFGSSAVIVGILKHEFYKTYIKTPVRFAARLLQAVFYAIFSNLHIKYMLFYK